MHTHADLNSNKVLTLKRIFTRGLTANTHTHTRTHAHTRAHKHAHRIEHKHASSNTHFFFLRCPRLLYPFSDVRGGVRFDVDKRAPGYERRHAHATSSATGEEGWNAASRTNDSAVRESGDTVVDSDQGEPGILFES